MPDSIPDVRGTAQAHIRLDSLTERVIVVETQQKELFKRIEKLEGVPDTLSEIKEALASTKATVEGMNGRVAFIWAIVGILLTGLLGLAWEFIKRGGPT